MSRYIKKPWFLLILLAVALLATVYKLRFSNADALWKIVSQQCVPHMVAEHNPQPCVAADIPAGVRRLSIDGEDPVNFLIPQRFLGRGLTAVCPILH